MIYTQGEFIVDSVPLNLIDNKQEAISLAVIPHMYCRRTVLPRNWVFVIWRFS